MKNIIENVQIYRENLAMLQQQNTEITKEATEAKAKSRALVRQLKNTTTRVTDEEEKVIRIRRLQNKYRTTAEDLYRENKRLKVATAAVAIRPREENEVIDSDADEHHEEVRSRHDTAPLSNIRGSNRHYTPATGAATERTGVIVNNNKRYPDVPDFHGSKNDRHK